MKTQIKITSTLLLTILLSSSALLSQEKLGIGDAMPQGDYAMEGIIGEIATLNQLKKENGLLVVFTSNTCPWVIGSEKQGAEGWEGRYNGLWRYCNENNIGMALLNSNEARRSTTESIEEMTLRVVANAFHAITTPHIFVFDKNLILQYQGAIDESVDSSKKAKKHYTLDALKVLIDGGEIDPSTTAARGCSIKRVKK